MTPRALARIASLLALVALLLWPTHAQAAPAWAVQPVPAWVVAVAPAEPGSLPSAAETPNGGRYLLFDRQVRAGTVVESYIRSSRQITNQAGLAASSQVSIDFDPTYETLALHSVVVRRGSESFNRLVEGAVRIVQRERNLEAQIFDGRQSAVLFIEDLRVGDIVESSFTLRSADPTAQGHFTDAIFLGAPEPVARLHARLVMTGGRRPRLLVHAPDGDRSSFAAEPRTTSEGTEYEWDQHDVRAFIAEPLTPSWYVGYPWVQVSDFESWAEVAAWGSRLFKVETPTRGSLFDWVKKNRAAGSADDFLLRAIRFVQDEIRYVGIETGMSRRRPNDPNVVFERRYGDCKDKATLLVTILKMAGIEAQPALVSTTRGHVLDEDTPSGAAFDHAIVRIGALGEKAYWVDATQALQGGGLERLRYSGFEHALVLGETGGRLEPLARAPARRASPSYRDKYIVPMPTKSREARLDSERIYVDDVADMMRAQLRGKTAEELTKLFLSVYQPDFPTVREAAPIEQTDDRERNVMRVVLHFAVPQFWTPDDDKGPYSVNVSARSLETALPRPTAAVRSAPLGLLFPLHIANDIDLELPFDLTIKPEQVTIGGDHAFALKFSSTYANRRLSYAYDLTTRVAFIDAGDVDAHLKEVDKARVALARSLTYRVPAQDGFNWAALVALLGMVPFACWGAYRAYGYEPRIKKPAFPVMIDPRLEGIRGWLALLAISIVLTPIWTVVSAVRSARAAFSLASWSSLTTPGLPTYAPGLAVTIILEVACLAAFVAYGIVVAVLFFRKRRSFPFHFTVYAVSMAVFTIVDHIAAAAFVANPEPAAKVVDGLTATGYRTVIWAAIWISYVRQSRRAAATFVQRGPRRRPRRARRSDPPADA